MRSNAGKATRSRIQYKSASSSPKSKRSPVISKTGNSESATGQLDRVVDRTESTALEGATGDQVLEPGINEDTSGENLSTESVELTVITLHQPWASLVAFGHKQWENQVKNSVTEIGTDFGGGSCRAGIPREWLPSADWVYEFSREPNGYGISPGGAVADSPQIGVASIDGDNRDRREALGNALGWRVAAVGLKRIDYLSQLATKHRSAEQN